MDDLPWGCPDDRAWAEVCSFLYITARVHNAGYFSGRTVVVSENPLNV